MVIKGNTKKVLNQEKLKWSTILLLKECLDTLEEELWWWWWNDAEDTRKEEGLDGGGAFAVETPCGCVHTSIFCSSDLPHIRRELQHQGGETSWNRVSRNKKHFISFQKHDSKIKHYQWNFKNNDPTEWNQPAHHPTHTSWFLMTSCLMSSSL